LYLRTISILVVCAAVVAAIVDYQFKIISSGILRTETDLVGFFGVFYAATGVSTLVLQFVLASRAFQRFGVVIVMGVLPLMLGLGSMSILFWPVLWSVVLAKFSDQTFRFTLHNGGLELLWLPVPPNQRNESKPFITGSVKSITEGATGVMMYGLLQFLTTAQLSIVALACGGVWAVSLFKLRSLYVSELQSAIANRRLPPEDLEVSTTDALTVQVIDRALQDGDTLQRIFVLELIANVPLTPWRSTLQRLLDEGEPEVTACILKVAGNDKTIVTDEALAQIAGKEGLEAIEAIRLIGTRGGSDLHDAVIRRLDDAQPAIRAAAYGSLAKLNGRDMPRVREALENMLRSGKAEDRIAALEESSHLDGVLTATMLEPALIDSLKQVRLEALKAAASHPDEKYARSIAASLGDSALFAAARDALAVLPSTSVLPILVDQLGEEAPASARRAALRAMKICSLPAAYPVLLREVDGHWPVLADEASESLIEIARKAPAPPEVVAIGEARRSDLIRTVGTLKEVLDEVPESDDAVLLRDYIEVSIARLLSAIIRLACINRPHSPIEACIQILHNRDRARIPFVLELFDTILSPAERQKILPLLESTQNSSPSSGTDRGSSEASARLATWLIDSLDSRNEWLRVIVIDYVLSGYSPVPLEQIDSRCVSKSSLVREVFASRIRSNPDLARKLPGLPAAGPGEEKSAMLTTLEKTILLKSVPLFKDIPGEDLSRVAQIANDQIFAAGEVICRDGDPGDCLYVIVSGSVRIQKRGRELAVLSRAHSLGEMAVLDSSPRSADAIAIEDTAVLRVGQEQFLEIMQSNSEIMQGVVRTLLARLRRIDDQLAGMEAAAGAQSVGARP
jgi:hypothetical protein